MSSHSIKILFVEGDDREISIINNMINTFFNSQQTNVRVIPIAVGQNIYMLWKLLKSDDFNSDIIELVRDKVPGASQHLHDCTRQNVDEVYLFFDLDKQQNNLLPNENPDDIMQEMLATFDNETENGKLYISYPMVEALRDFRDGYCQPFYKCVLLGDDISNDNYKTQTGSTNNNFAQIKRYKSKTWKAIIEFFALRLRCLCDNHNLDFTSYRKNISPQTIWQIQKSKYLDKNEIFVLSAFPEFLLDYFTEVFFISNTRQKKPKFLDCPKK